jgi:septum formation protein
MTVPRIVLASTSRYRRELLERLRLPFEVQSPGVDEQAFIAETPLATALRLAQTKALAVQARHEDALVIGSDQVAELDGQALEKPGTHARALAQLEQLSGRTAIFHTALALAHPFARQLRVANVPTRVHFRSLPRAQLDTYLSLDQPYDCAGAAKVESLGIALIERVESDDPTALIGLPLICLTTMLAEAGVSLFHPR